MWTTLCYPLVTTNIRGVGHVWGHEVRVQMFWLDTSEILSTPVSELSRQKYLHPPRSLAVSMRDRVGQDEGVTTPCQIVVMARLITRIVVRSFGGSEPLEVFQAPEPNSLKLSGFLDAYCGYFGKPLAELQMAGDGKNCLVGWVFGVPEDYDASDLPASPAFFELAVIPLVPDPDPDCLGLLTPALWQSHLLQRKPSSGISYATEEASVRLVDPDVLREYISIPVS